jgi:hypothetical protein
VATLAELKTRVITETNRDDMGSGGALETTLTLCITQAIEFYAREQFWFNRANGTGATTANVSTISMPSGVRYPRFVSYNGDTLGPVTLDEIQYRTETGIPSKWAENEGSIQIWPIPNAAYTIGVYGLASTGIPATGSDTNIWTTEAYDLIAARTRRLIYQDYLRDTEGAALAKISEDEALGMLREETRRRVPVMLRSDVPQRRNHYYNINAG